MQVEKLRAEGLRKSFGSLEVLQGVSLAANAGDVIAMIGSSGSGKSTVLRCLNLLEKPNAGRITVSGEELARDYPSVMKAGAYFGTGGFDKTFELGLEMFLDEMERVREAARNENRS